MENTTPQPQTAPENNNNKLLTAGLAIVSLAILTLSIVSLVAPRSIIVNLSAGTPGAIGATSFTQQTSNGKYNTPGSDADQNIQAVVERMASGTPNAILQANANGSMERTDPASLGSSPWNFSSTTRISSLVSTGGVITVINTTTLTAQQLCAGGLILGASITPQNPLQITLPSSSSLFAACLNANGNHISIPLVSPTGSTSTLIVAGTGGIASPSSTLSIPNGVGVILTLIRTSTNSDYLFVVNAR